MFILKQQQLMPENEAQHKGIFISVLKIHVKLQGIPFVTILLKLKSAVLFTITHFVKNNAWKFVIIGVTGVCK